MWDIAGSLPLLLKDGTTAYVYGPGGLPLEQVGSSATYWYHHDQVGSTRLITDATGTSQATYIYDPFGGLASSTGSITNPFWFVGQYNESESGFYYLRARYYDPSTGQFDSIDPSPMSTQGPYRYATDNPLNQVDPTGLCSLNPFAGDSCVGQAANAVKNTVSSIRIAPPSPPNFTGAGQWGMFVGGLAAFDVAGFLAYGAIVAAAAGGAFLLVSVGLTVLVVAAVVVGVLLIAGAYGYGPWAYHDPTTDSPRANVAGSMGSVGAALGLASTGGQGCV